MKILYCGLLYNYGKPDEGFSYEHMNVEAGLRAYCKSMGWQRDLYYPDAKLPNDDNDCLSELQHYNAIFHVAFNEALDLPEHIARLALKLDIPVIQWDCDASWRFQSWIAPRKDRVSHFITTHSSTVDWYKKAGMNVIKSQWAGSPKYMPADVDKQYDISFIGQKHGQMPDGRFVRAEVINAFMNAGLNVALFGNYWDGYPNWHGYLKDFEDVIRVFSASKICLNISNPWHYNTMPQIKGRHFEIPQTGSFQLCTPADDLESYFEPDFEIVIGRSINELVEQANYYLLNEDARERIAAQGHLRNQKDHQWHNRFDHIFKEVGLL